MLLLPSVEVTTTIQKYTIWIWLDESANPDSNLTWEMLDIVVWTGINLTEGLETLFEITKLTNNYQIINATGVNNKRKIVSYAITTNNSEPTEWIEIDTGISKMYSMSLVKNEIYYGCVKLIDNSGNVTYIKSNAVKVSVTSGT